MPSALELEAIDGLLQLNPVKKPAAKTKYQDWYDKRCACMKKAREARLAKLAARKNKKTP
jgi:hypothetical protein